MKFWDSSKDLEKERVRYDLASSIEKSKALEYSGEGFLHFPAHHIAPFKEYYSWIEKELVNSKDVLEIGAGTGQHTRPVVTPSTRVTALDISERSLEVIQSKFKESVRTIVGNIEDLPFSDSSFDLVISCGVLSYGDPSKVDREILRILRPGGTFLFIDSLNHNPIYKVNRWIRFCRGNRSLSTVLRVPKMGRINNLASSFEQSHRAFFGQWIWVYQLARICFGAKSAIKINNFLEKPTFNGKYSFKIVAMLKGRQI